MLSPSAREKLSDGRYPTPAGPAALLLREVSGRDDQSSDEHPHRLYQYAGLRAVFLGGLIALVIIVRSYLALPCSSGALGPALRAIGIASAALPVAGVLRCFQVHRPVSTPPGLAVHNISNAEPANPIPVQPLALAGACTKLLMQHSFGFSYGHPFVGMYS
jgi:hypothetical protein